MNDINENCNENLCTNQENKNIHGKNDKNQKNSSKSFLSAIVDKSGKNVFFILFSLKCQYLIYYYGFYFLNLVIRIIILMLLNAIIIIKNLL